MDTIPAPDPGLYLPARDLGLGLYLPGPVPDPGLPARDLGLYLPAPVR